MIKSILFILILLYSHFTLSSETIDRIKKTKSITVAYSYYAYPIAFRDKYGNPNGYSIDICRRVITSIKNDLKLDTLKIKWINGTTPQRINFVATGKADMECGTTTVTYKRQKLVDFSYITFIESGSILAKNSIKHISDLEGKRIGLLHGTTTEYRLREYLSKRLIDFQLVIVKDNQDGLRKLESGEIDATANDRLILLGHLIHIKNPEKYSILKQKFSIEPYAFAVPRNDSDFRLMVDKGLAQIYKTNEIADIFSKWFGNNAQPTDLLKSIFTIVGNTR